jgi:aryl-alcohol dehydrogenase-like predicted oxidoreductase
MERRRLGRLEHESSVLVFGAASLGGVTQEVADASVAQALEAGINHFDVAASYGDAELRLGPWHGRLGFLATKTGERDREPAWAQINASLERLQCDRVDLLQLHAVGDVAELDRVTAPGGALEAAVRARDEGLVGAIGITGHGHAAPRTHLEALRRFPFETVLTPWNHVLSRRDDFRADFLALVDEVERQDAALLTIKAVARRNWPAGTSQHLATWYEPWEDDAHLTASLAFALRQPGVTAIATPGDVTMLDRTLSAMNAMAALSDDEIDSLMTGAAGYSSPFVSMPF